MDLTDMLEEWQELTENYKNLETSNKTYQEKLADLAHYQKECVKQIQHQKYRISVFTKLIKNQKDEKIDEFKEELLKREVQLDEIQQTLPKENELYLKVILGNVNVSILSREDKLKYKSEYEKFKLVLSVVVFVLAISNLLVVNRALERIQLFVLVWYYSTLTIRESILKINGSRIKGWWRLHHFISAVAAAVLLIWPEGPAWQEFRAPFMWFNAYLSVVQYLQFRYQQGVLYRLKAMGKKQHMDITIEGFHYWMWKGLSFLFPFLFSVYAIELYLAMKLYVLRKTEGASWHVAALSVIFLILALGNITTAVMIIPNKFKRNVKLKWQILSQRLHSWRSTEKLE